MGGGNKFKGFGGGEGIQRRGEEIQREGKGRERVEKGNKEERKKEWRKKGREKGKKRRGKGNKSGFGTHHSISTYLIYTFNSLTTKIAM